MNSQNTSPVTFNWFRKIAYIEGWSYLLLLVIAMPLKYLFDYPLGVKIIGPLHGILFVAMAFLGLLVMAQYKKNVIWLFKAFIASLLPLGTFFMDREWKKEEQEISLKP